MSPTTAAATPRLVSRACPPARLHPRAQLEWSPYNPAKSSTKAPLPCGSSGCDLVCTPADRADFNGCSCPAAPKAKTRGLLGATKQAAAKSCNYDILYSDNTESAGPIVADRLHSGPAGSGADAPNTPLVFGCAKTSSVFNNKVNAVVGLNREPGSLLSQLVAAKVREGARGAGWCSRRE